MKHAIAVAGLFLFACSSPPVARVESGTAVDHGEFLFGDPSASPSSINAFSCSTCHTAGGATAELLTGADLAGVVERPTYWGGSVNDLLTAINACRNHFMSAQRPWTADDEEAKAMWAYLSSLPSDDPDAVPFTVLRSVHDLPPGDAAAGASVYARACQSCHGELHTGNGRISPRASRIPDDPVKEHVGYTVTEQRVVFVEKIRHGGFLGYAGNMPPFSMERLGDDDLSDLLSYMGMFP